jgi:hypothetical protein
MPSPKWMNETDADRHGAKTHGFGNREEKKVVRKLKGARTTPRSGAGATKGDARLHVKTKAETVTKKDAELHIEIKSTTNDGFRVSRTIIDKLMADSGYNRHPVLIVRLVGKTPRKSPRTMVCMPLASFKEITGMDVELGDG